MRWRRWWQSMQGVSTSHQPQQLLACRRQPCSWLSLVAARACSLHGRPHLHRYAIHSTMHACQNELCFHSRFLPYRHAVFIHLLHTISSSSVRHAVRSQENACSTFKGQMSLQLVPVNAAADMPNDQLLYPSHGAHSMTTHC